jgi:hypothetical protein
MHFPVVGRKDAVAPGDSLCAYTYSCCLLPRTPGGVASSVRVQRRDKNNVRLPAPHTGTSFVQVLEVGTGDTLGAGAGNGNGSGGQMLRRC